jgi:hypothetical protein
MVKSCAALSVAAFSILAHQPSSRLGFAVSLVSLAFYIAVTASLLQIVQACEHVGVNVQRSNEKASAAPAAART